MKHAHNTARVLFRFLLASFMGTEVLGATYSTDFPLTENPISEGGNWINGMTTGLDWTDVLTLNATAFGTETGLLGYDDSAALLTGTWGSNQTCTAKAFKSGSSPVEVELRLRSALSAHNCTGYEVLFSAGDDSDAYVQIVLWNGPLGDFDFVSATNGPQCIWTNGSTLQATISNSTITAYINGTMILQGVDTTYASGNPGIGFFGGLAVNDTAGFTSFTATDGVDAPVIVSQPQTEVINLMSSATFGVVAKGAGPLSYQWYFDVTNVIDGATNNLLVLTNVQDSDEGWYSVSVSNAVGTFMSDSAQLVVNHLPVPASPTLPRYWNSGFKVWESLLLGVDPDGDPVSLISVGPLSAQGATVTASQGWVFYSPPASFTSSDAFGYTVDDGRGGSATGAATIVVITNQSPSLNLAWMTNADGSIVVSGSGIPNRSYSVEFAEGLESPNWQPLATVMSDDVGVLEYVDPPPAGVEGRFYRVVTY